MTNFNHLYNPPAAQKFFGKDYFVDKKLHFRIIERGTILPVKSVNAVKGWSWKNFFGGIVDQRGEFIKSSFVHYGIGDAYTPTEKVKYSPTTVIYLGMFFHVWGHAITDNIRRLWFLNSDIFNRCFKNCSLVYLPFDVGGGYIVNNKKIFGGCLKFWKSMSSVFSQSINPCNLKILSCPMNPFLMKEEQNSQRSIAR